MGVGSSLSPGTHTLLTRLTVGCLVGAAQLSFEALCVLLFGWPSVVELFPDLLHQVIQEDVDVGRGEARLLQPGVAALLAVLP